MVARPPSTAPARTTPSASSPTPSRPAKPPPDASTAQPSTPPREDHITHVPPCPLQELRQNHLGRLRPTRRPGQGSRRREPMVPRPPGRPDQLAAAPSQPLARQVPTPEEDTSTKGPPERQPLPSCLRVPGHERTDTTGGDGCAPGLLRGLRPRERTEAEAAGVPVDR